MNVIAVFRAASAAMRQGEIVVHPVRWKSAQALSVVLVSIAVPLYSAFCDSPSACGGLGQDDVKNIAIWAGGAAFALFQVWATLATSKKIGIGKRANYGDVVGHDSVREPARPPGAAQLPPEDGWLAASTRPGDPQRGSTFDDDVYGSFKQD